MKALECETIMEQLGLSSERLLQWMEHRESCSEPVSIIANTEPLDESALPPIEREPEQVMLLI
ncbi:hypothetical protein [Paenibacillus sp. YYML68]|uniref:hypothetical protein n=1 Tax=Paenibacillus sp. YYML68 TaxID=2909250 RepID=UPI0024913A28|nr:hypothetical protein [Paenibacillus sp. YYML68]